MPVRRPRGVVKIAGQPASFLRFSVTNNNHYAADRWTVDLEAWNQPENFGLNYWADVGDVQVECLIGFLGPNDPVDAAPASPTSLILGQVDDVDIDPLTGRVTLSGRDLTGLLIDTKTSNLWPDKTSSEIATLVAQQAELTPQVTTTKVGAGRYYQAPGASFWAAARDIPLWDLLVFLAQQEGFDVYVTGNTLYSGPPQADTDASPFTITMSRSAQGQITSSVHDLKLRRSLTFAQDISVTVLSHSIQTGKSIKAFATRAGKKVVGSSASGVAEKTQSYVIRRPNMTQEQAQNLANNMALEISKHERVFEAVLEGDPTLGVHKMARITGTGSSFDQSYYIDRIVRTFAFESGFEMTVHGKNHPTQSEPTL